MDEAAKQEIIRYAELQEFGTFDRVSRFADLAKQTDENLKSEPIVADEGHHPNGVFLVRSGVARLSHKFHNGHRTVGYLTNGSAFGFDEVSEGFRTGQTVPFQHSLRAIGYLLTIFIPTPIIEKHVLKHPDSEVNRKKSGHAAAQGSSRDGG